jgi:hypothetical protein
MTDSPFSPNKRQIHYGFAGTVLQIPFVRGLDDEKGPVRRVETPRRGFKATEFDEEGVQPDEEDSRPRKPDVEAQTDEKGPTRSLV